MEMLYTNHKMYCRQLLNYSLAVALVFSFFSCSSDRSKEEEKAYVSRLISERNQKDIDLVDTTTSRFNEEERARFAEKGLQYFDPDFQYVVDAGIRVDTSHPPFKMPTTTDRRPNYRIYGFLEFMLKDTLCELVAYQNMDYRDHSEYGGMLFIPFYDNTNEFTTYGGGRYIDIKIPVEKEFKLDFNSAYNPYCAYSDRWSCPLVPFNNTLELSVFAGEKAYK